MALRHLHRALRLASASWSSPQHAAALPGLVTWNQPFCGLSSSSTSPPLPAMQEFARAFSSAYTPSRASDIYEYNNLISVIDFKKRPSLNRAVYEDMLVDGVQPIYDTFFLLLNSSMRASRLQDVMFFFDEMKAMGITPDVACYNCVIAACGRTFEVDRAFQVAEEMEASGLQLRHRTFLALLRSCAISGRVDQAYGVVRRMAASGLSLDKNFYSALIMAHSIQFNSIHKNRRPSSEESIQKIFELLEQSKQHSREDQMAVAATGELETEADADDGLATMLSNDMLPRRGFLNRRLAVYHAAVKSLSSLGNKEAVKSVLNMVEMDGHEPDSYCLIQLIKCYLAEGDFEQACAEFSKYVDTGKQPTLELYIILIEGALDNYSPASSAVAQRLLADIAGKGYFLNAQVGSEILQRTFRASSRDIAVANLAWDMMKSREVRISKYITNEYFRALQRSNIPEEDPRYIEVKALVDKGGRIDLKVWKDPPQMGISEQMPGQMVPSEQMPEQMVLAEQVLGHSASSEQMPGQMVPAEQVLGHSVSSEQVLGHSVTSEQVV